MDARPFTRRAEIDRLDGSVDELGKPTDSDIRSALQLANYAAQMADSYTSKRSAIGLLRDAIVILERIRETP